MRELCRWLRQWSSCCVAGHGREAAGERGAAALGDGGIFDHGLAGAGAEDEAFEKGIAGEAVGAVNSGGGCLACGIEAGERGAAPEVGFHAAHEVVGGGADGSHVGGEVQTVAGTGGEDAREAFFEEVF